MAKIERFEDLVCWQKARGLSNMIYDLTERKTFNKDSGLRLQLQRAAGSVMHNIAEGFDAGSKPEFIRFLKMSRRSASEIQSELYQALDRNYITETERQAVYSLATETKRLINGLIRHLRGKPDANGD
jgi:four helix bundle protein